MGWLWGLYSQDTSHGIVGHLNHLLGLLALRLVTCRLDVAHRSPFLPLSQGQWPVETWPEAEEATAEASAVFDFGGFSGSGGRMEPLRLPSSLSFNRLSWSQISVSFWALISSVASSSLTTTKPPSRRKRFVEPGRSFRGTQGAHLVA